MNNTGFSTVIHILTLLADHPGQWLNSDLIAGSIHINPVIVRRELSLLQNIGWVTTRKGKEGGSALAVNSKDIRLSDIYLLVKRTDVLGKKNKNANPNCHIGRQINKQLDQLFQETDTLLINALKKKTLAGFLKNFKASGGLSPL